MIVPRRAGNGAAMMQHLRLQVGELSQGAAVTVCPVLIDLLSQTGP